MGNAPDGPPTRRRRRVPFQRSLAPMKLSSNDRTIQRVLAETYFNVPRYQRPYSWTRDNVEELWDDAIQERDGDYFIGSMVVHPLSRSSDTVAVVDGQQRLTTLLMFLCAVRDAADAQGLETLAKGTHNLVERRDAEDQVRPVLRSETAHPFLEDLVLTRGAAQLGEAQGEEQESIRDAFVVAKAKVAKVVEAVMTNPRVGEQGKAKRIEKELRDLREQVLGLQVVFVETASRDDATTVFVTLNSRGKDLEPSDLVKAHMLSQLPKSGSLDQPLQRWQQIVDLFDASENRPDMNDFLLAVWRSRYGSATAKSLDKAVRKVIKRAQADAFLDELTEDARLFRILVEPSFRKWGQHTDLADSLRFFLTFGIRQPRPMTLALLRAYEAKSISVSQIRRALRAIENYHFTFHVLAGRSSTGGLSALYASRALRLTKATTSQERASILDEFVADLKKKRPTDDEFDVAFEALEFLEGFTADKRKIQYILRRFYERDGGSAPVDYAKMTIEHVASQSSSDAEIGTIGNLIYISEGLNNQLDNKSFPAKKRIMEGAGEWIPPEVLAVDRWTGRQIEARTKAMAERARDVVWR